MWLCHASGVARFFIPGATATEKQLSNATAKKQLSIAAAGAVGDGVTLNTAAIQKAIDALATNGGGTLVIPRVSFCRARFFSSPE